MEGTYYDDKREQVHNLAEGIVALAQDDIEEEEDAVRIVTEAVEFVGEMIVDIAESLSRISTGSGVTGL